MYNLLEGVEGCMTFYRLLLEVSIQELRIKSTFTWQHHLKSPRRVDSNSLLLGKHCEIKLCLQVCYAAVCPVLGKQRTLGVTPGLSWTTLIVSFCHWTCAAFVLYGLTVNWTLNCLCCTQLSNRPSLPCYFSKLMCTRAAGSLLAFVLTYFIAALFVNKILLN